MRTVLAIGGATLLVVMLLIGLMMQRRRHYLDRIAFEAKARRELEMRVAERTSDLEGLNRRVPVEEVLEREHAQQELVRAQDDLVQAGKLSALGTMSASISHELNQPLAAIRSYAENAEVLLDHQRIDDARGNLKLINELTGRSVVLPSLPTCAPSPAAIATHRKASPCNRRWTMPWRCWPSRGRSIGNRTDS